ncbi:MAG TPA: ACT domain-containing protein [Terriglobales bacterium]|nr:ACT domain-containing protein [Terriglobales bacterium]
MARVTQLLIKAENKPGTLAGICTGLAAMAVNIQAVMAAPVTEGGIRIVASPHATAKRVLDGLRIPYKEEEAVAVRLNDRPGALGKVTRKLAEKGINVTYAYGSIVKGDSRALIILGVSDVEKAADLV